MKTIADRRWLTLRAPVGRGTGLALVAGLSLAWVIAGPVLAHADLVGSDPADKAILAAPPTTITLAFSEALDPVRSSFKVIGPAGLVATGKVAGNPSSMTLAGLQLTPGSYEIQWTSVAGDGDLLRGTLTFTVSELTPAPATPVPSSGPSTPPSTPASTSPVPAATTAPTPAPSAAPAAPVASSVDVLLPIVAALALVAGAGAFLLRRSRRV